MQNSHFIFVLSLSMATASIGTASIGTAGESVSLFNGTDLSGWHTDIPDADGGAEIAPSFVVRGGMLVSLGSPQGHLITDAVYQDYRLVVEYRWTKEPGNCGVLVHASTPRRLYKMFPSSIECQMYVGNAGDFWCIGEDIAVENMVLQRGPEEKWGVDEGRARRIRNVTDDSESPIGEWNQMVIECRGRTVDVWVNGDYVNHGFGCTVDRGQIAIQAEGAEAEFRRVELTQLGLPATSPMPRSTDTPQRFAPGIVSTEANEFATSFSPDGRTVYFSRSSEGQIQIYRSNWNDGWGIPTPLEWSAGTRDMDPFVSPSGDLLFFASNRDSSEPRPEPGYDLWMSPRTKVAGTEAGWGPPMLMSSPPNTSGMDAFMSVSASGTLYFDSKAVPNGVRRIYRSLWSAGEYGPSKEVDLGLPDEVSVGNPLVLPNERALIFASRGLGGPGGADLYISYCAADGSWGPPKALPGSINSPFEEYAPGLGADGHTLFFTSTRGSKVDETSDRRPPGDIYFVRLPILEMPRPASKQQEAMADEAESRKDRSIAILKDEEVPFSEHLPVIATEAESTRRSAEQVAKRAMALCIVAVKGEGIDQEVVDRLVEDYAVASAFTPNETDFINRANPTQSDQVQFAWRYECYWLMLWALGYIDELDRPGNICDVEAAVSFLRDNGRDGFIKNAKLRPQAELLNAADLIYRYHWAVVDARVNNREAPAGLDGGVVQERHHALNWLVGYLGQEWDDVSTDT